MYYICTYGEQTPLKAGQICTGTDFYNRQNKEAQAIYLTWLKMLREVYDYPMENPPIFDLRTTPNTFVIKGMDTVRFYGVEAKGHVKEIKLASLMDGLIVAKAIAQRDTCYNSAHIKRCLKDFDKIENRHYNLAALTTRIKVIREFTAHEIFLLSRTQPCAR